MKSKNILLALAASAAAVLSCSKEPGMTAAGGGMRTPRVSVAVQPESLGDGAVTRAAERYDKVEFAVAYADGTVVGNLKGFYDRVSSILNIEGLQEGNYMLFVLGVKGNHGGDGVEFRKIAHVSDTWISFPEDMDRPLAAEYFYSSTPFSVKAVSSEEGRWFAADIAGNITQKRIVGRLDFSYSFANPYTASAVLSNEIVIDSPKFRTGMSADGGFSGVSSGASLVLDAAGTKEFLFLPTAEGGMAGENEIITRNYRGDIVRRVYSFSGGEISPGRISRVSIDAVHPDDRNGTMFITERHYAEGGHGAILQDGEPHGIYTDFSQRSFNTAEPLQVSVEDGRLHVRFYSPKDLAGVLVRAVLPGSGGEYVDLAWFDRIPAFADFYETLPVTLRSAVYRSESGRMLEIPRTDAEGLSAAVFRIESEDPYWAKLQEIRHGWNIRFALYGGDPGRPDGGPSGNWMGIRPVHCREAVAFFLNFTYMIDMPEHERILRENQDRLYGNGGVNDKITPETVLGQMRQGRTINVGLVYTGHNVYGLGGGNVFGAYQGGWFNHYTSAYACEVMFHELGHVMGYSHDSSFTYGPWAQELMNNFYVKHLSSMPVDSPEYLDSRNNANAYASEPKSLGAAGTFFCQTVIPDGVGGALSGPSIPGHALRQE